MTPPKLSPGLAALLAQIGPDWRAPPVKRVPNTKLTRLRDLGLIEVRTRPGPNQSGLLIVECRRKPE